MHKYVAVKRCANAYSKLETLDTQVSSIHKAHHRVNPSFMMLLDSLEN